MCRIRAKPAVEILDADENATHLRDRVDAQMRTRAVRRTPDRLDFEIDEAAVGDRDLHLRRLGHDRCVRTHGGCDRLGSDARELLIGDGREDDVTAQAAPAGLSGREHAGREASLHVVRATAVEPPSLEPRDERVGHAGDTDGVRVRIEDQ